MATTGSGDSKPVIEVITGSVGPNPASNSKPANEVITGFLPEMTMLAQDGQRTASSSEAYCELIELELAQGRNAMSIYQDLIDRYGFTNSYPSARRVCLLSSDPRRLLAPDDRLGSGSQHAGRVDAERVPKSF